MTQSATSLNKNVPALQASKSDAGAESYASFLESFPLQGEQLYATLFDRHSDIIQTQKARFAIANLQKIFAATFEVSSVSGFDRMSLRDLSRSTGMSMGAIYSCISKKEDIALMVADIVRQSSELTRRHALQADSYWAKIEQSIRFHLYASTLLQPWYFFLYFETRSLPEAQQEDSVNIELEGIASFEAQIQAGNEAFEFQCEDPRMVANTIVVMLEDWYLKPWKNREQTRKPKTAKHTAAQRVGLDHMKQEEQLDNYYQSLIKLVKHMLAA